MVKDTQVAVTGMAWTTALGKDLATVWEKLKAGESGLKKLPSQYELRNELVGQVESSSPALSPRDHLYEMTLDTVHRALSDAGIDKTSQKILLIIGTSFGARLDDSINQQESLHDWVDRIAAELGVSSLSLSTACSSGSDAILMGDALIKSGVVDICICGGADILGDSKRLAHTALGTMSPSTLRSFDENREGTILGEGAGFVVLEKFVEQSNVKAFLRGCGAANDAAGLTAPDENGKSIKLTVQRALNEAELSVSEIELINAHASGTPTNDVAEIGAYKTIFAGNKPTVFATKGAFGHTLGATGALEAIALILALNEKVVPPVYALSDPIEKNSFNFPMDQPMQHDAQFGLSLTIGFGGFNTGLIFERAA